MTAEEYDIGYAACDCRAITAGSCARAAIYGCAALTNFAKHGAFAQPRWINR